MSGSEHSAPAAAKKRKIVHEVLSPAPSNSSSETVLNPLEIDAEEEMLLAEEEMLLASPLMQEESSDDVFE